MVRLDRTGQRIVGVLIEKQFSVPDSYPMTENALLAGCNQTSNRDPVMDLRQFQLAGALMALQQEDVIARVEGGGRVAKFRHKLGERLSVGDHDLAVLAELLLRGPQAPGALKPRVARMGFHGTPEQVEEVLRALAARSPALVQQLPLGPRERDRRWRHLLGDGSEGTELPVHAAESTPVAAPAPGTTPNTTPGTASASPDRIGQLEQRLTVLEAEVRALRQRLDGDSPVG